MKKHNFLLFVYLVLSTSITEAYAQSQNTTNPNSHYSKFLSIPLAGNSWGVNKSGKAGEIISGSGVKNWKEASDQIITYFKVDKPGKIQIALTGHVPSGESKIRCQLGRESKELSMTNSASDTLNIGTFIIENKGYQSIILNGIKKSADYFAEITHLIIGGEAIDANTRYVKDEFYWGRRGPSVHLNYEVLPSSGDVTWFYNELTIPEGNDVQGSYFMANGFGEGYFGIQVNSATERRILFSVWSPYKTDKPTEIPEDQKIILLKKGDNVNAGAFGNEGSGGQSYRKYNWKSGTTYRFLLKGAPSENSSTDYTAYFFAPEIGQWELIASFRRPKTTTYLTHLHSFLENFIPDQGNITRMGSYSNQWVCSTSGQWTELTRARFTADATARKEARLDYTGGVENGGFFLKNCGFFNEKGEIGSWFVRPASGKKPEINFSALP